MIVNFKAREISRGARKLARTPTLKKKKKRRSHLKKKHNVKRKLVIYTAIDPNLKSIILLQYLVSVSDERSRNQGITD
jgi:putative ribosome biogenesis GTPase RsgA